MTLPPLPEPEASFVDGEDQYGYATYSQAYTADQMLQLQRDTVEACAKACAKESLQYDDRTANVVLTVAHAIRSMKHE